MFDKILEKTEGAMTQLGKALSAFEQDSDNLQIKLKKKIEEYQIQANGELDKLDSFTKARMAEEEKRITDLLDAHQKNMAEVIDKSLVSFSKSVKDRFESIYTEYEVAAVNRAQNAFEVDMENVFKLYGDKIAPYIFKAILRYLFRFGRKTT